MRRFQSLSAAFLLLCFSASYSTCWAEVILSDEQAQQLMDNLTELEQINNEQKALNSEQKIIIDSQTKLLEEQKNLNDSQMTIINEQNKIINEQANSLQSQKKSWIRLVGEFSIWSLIIGFFAGFFIGG